jgi:hypothetical protein
MARHVTKFKIINLRVSTFYTTGNHKYEGRVILTRENTNNIQCMIINFRQQSATFVKLEFLAAVNINTRLFRQFIVQYSLVLMTSQPTKP